MAACNLVLAQMVRGDWDEALACDEELFVDLEVPVFELVRCHILLCRGQSWRPIESFERHGDEQDEGIAAFRIAVDARVGGWPSGTRAPLSSALSALREIHSVTSVYDDFTVLFLITTDVAWEVGDREVLEEMMALVDLRTRERLPRGLLAQHTRLRALLAAQDGEEPAQVERLFRACAGARRGLELGPDRGAGSTPTSAPGSAARAGPRRPRRRWPWRGRSSSGSARSRGPNSSTGSWRERRPRQGFPRCVGRTTGRTRGSEHDGGTRSADRGVREARRGQ